MRFESCELSNSTPVGNHAHPKLLQVCVSERQKNCTIHRLERIDVLVKSGAQQPVAHVCAAPR